MPRFAVLIIGIIALAALATWWLVSDNYEPEPPEMTEPTQADRIIKFCTVPANRTNPLCSVDPEDPEQVEEAVRDAVERRVEEQRIIERRIEDDDDNTPDTNIIIPPDNDNPAPQSPPPPPQEDEPPPLLPIEIPELPVLPAPDIPVPDLPLLP